MATAVERHYDDRAAAASAGPRTDLQRFHNAAKRALLSAFVRGAGRVLDLACGRGGDVHKWNDLGVRHVTGVDVSAASLQEARRRAAAAAAGSPDHHAAATREFVHADLALLPTTPTPPPWAPPGGFDAVTCMFALHYFFGDEACASGVVRLAAESLRPGGYFVGIVPDALEINDRLCAAAAATAPAHEDDAYEDDVSCIRALWRGPPACFGSAYTFSVRDTVVAAAAEAEVVEYLVYGSVLAALARAHGLEPVWHAGHPDLAACFEHAAREHLWRLRPPAAWAPDGGAARCSGTYAAFAFRKPGA